MIIIWKPIKNYKGLYWVSDCGKVRSKHKTLSLKRKGNNYIGVGLSKEGVVKFFRVHRLVAEAFISNPENKPEVNHIDGNKKNNNVLNLEWVTPLENSQHATSLKVGQFNKQGVLIKEYNAIREAERSGFHSPSISACCKGKLKTHKGYIWKYL